MQFQNKKVMLAVVVAVLVVLGGVTYWFFGRRASLPESPVLPQPQVETSTPSATETPNQ